MKPHSSPLTKKLTASLVALLLAAAGALPARGQNPPDTSRPPGSGGCIKCGDKGKTTKVPPSGIESTAATGPRTSPFEPPAENDHTYVTDSAPKLDTGCIFRSSGPITYDIRITRNVGALNSDGTLKDAAALVAAGLVSRTATLIMPAYDVDSDSTDPSIAPERDRVSFNGEAIGYLTGEDDVWKLNTFEIPIEKVRFAARGAAGSLPAAAVNQVRIDIDTANQDEVWCTSIDWGSQNFKAMSPIILIHGNNSDGGFFDRQGFTGELVRQKLLYDNSINLPTTFVENNGSNLDGQIPGIVKSFGVDSVHLVVHSKGGLDAREYLAKYQPKHDSEFKVLSLTTLSSPHNGSAGADVLVARADAANFVGLLGKVEFEGFPNYTRQLALILGVDDGKRNLTTSFAADFNARVIPRLPTSTIYNTVAADADTNGNNQMDRSPDEYAELRQENTGLRVVDSVSKSTSRYIIDAVYQILRNTRTVMVTPRTEIIVPGTLFTPPVTRKVVTISSVPNPTPLGNDTLVTIPSALGVGSFQSLVTNSRTFTGADGRNHSSVANAGVAATVIPWIISVEKTRGDLR